MDETLNPSKKIISAVVNRTILQGTLAAGIAFVLGMLASGAVLVALWYWHKDTLAVTYLTSIALFGLFFACAVHSINAIRVAGLRAYKTIYIMLIKAWVNPLALHLVDVLWKYRENPNAQISKDIKEGAKDIPLEELNLKIMAWLSAKFYALPAWIAKGLLFICNLTPIGNYIVFIDASWIRNLGSKEELLVLLEEKIENYLRNLAHNATPSYAHYVVPVHFIILFALFLL